MKSVFFKLSFIVIIIIALMILSPRQSLLSQKYDDESVFVNVTVAGQVQRVLLDDYLLGVVAGEMPASFELEAIKAQVVASRTFVYSRLLSVDNTTNTQVYLNEEEMKKSWQDHYEDYKAKIEKAIEATRGEIMTYQGECISALFYSSSNGKSENVENYFAGSPKSYLVSVDSPWDEKYDSSFLREKSFSRAELNQCFGDFVYRDMIRYPSGRVQSMVINGKNYTGRQVREKLQLASSDFTIEKEGDDFVFVTKGNGHGVGMSQYGAQGMAKEGYGYVDILKHYYQGIDITRNKE
ncbi:stage II sporulation protein D [[Clostridium] spiroforme]|nr:stage II sporulation protein D [Thomasclavelia spiroformis]